MRETANQFINAGWDVTVVTIAQDSWERDSGIDLTLLNEVDSRVKTVELPLSRVDLETDIRLFDEERAASPNGWLTKLRNRQRQTFPEPNFGAWRGDLERAVLDIHAEHPADLLLASCVPYVTLAAAWKLWEEARVPYAVDFRDGWSIDVIDGVEAFSRDSEEARWEEDLGQRALPLGRQRPHRGSLPRAIRSSPTVCTSCATDTTPTARRAAPTPPTSNPA